MMVRQPHDAQQFELNQWGAEAVQTMSLRQAVATTLRSGGSEFLHNPKRFIGFVTDLIDPESPAARILYVCCNDRFLEAFAEAYLEGTPKAFSDAASDAATYIANEFVIDPTMARSLCWAVAAGCADSLGKEMPALGQAQAESAVVTDITSTLGQYVRADSDSSVMDSGQRPSTPAGEVASPFAASEKESGQGGRTGSGPGGNDLIGVGAQGQKPPQATSVPMRGKDVHAEVDLTASEARSGITKAVESTLPSGATYRTSATIPAGTTDGAVISLPGMGEPGRNGGVDGDLIVTVRVAEAPKRKVPSTARIAAIIASVVVGLMIAATLMARTAVSFDGNGATSGSMSDLHAKLDGTFELPASSFERSGYRFAGWSTSKSGTPKSAGSTVTIDEPTTYYARWEAIVSFDGNGATSGAMDDVSAGLDGSLQLPENRYSRTDYQFAGWSSSKDGTPVTPGSTVDVNKPTTFYARWKAIVSFDGNGATSGSEDDIVADFDGRIELPGRGDFERDDYYQLGWATSASGDPVDPNETVTVNEPTTYYAIWSPYVSFDGNGASSGSVSRVHADKDGIVVLPDGSYTYADHTFMGWKTSKDTNEYYKVGARFKAKEPTTLYALWELDSSVRDKVAIDFKPLRTTDEGKLATFIYFTNNSSSTLGIDLTVNFYRSGSQVETIERERMSVAPGERTFVITCSSESGPDYADCIYSVKDPEYGNGSLFTNIRVQETKVEADKLVFQLVNKGNTRAYIYEVSLVCETGNGGWTAPYRFPQVFIDPGESTEITLDYCPSPGWSSYDRTYYVDGYME